MKHLSREDFDAVIKSGKSLILFFYRENHAPSSVAMGAVEEVNNLIAKDFELFAVNVNLEPEIANAFSVIDVPETVSVKNMRIYKRASGTLFSNQILALIK